MANRARRAGLAGGAAAALAASIPVDPIAAHAASRIHCTASMSNGHPQQYSHIYVDVHTGAHASIHTTAHYKTSTTSKTSHGGRANAHGNAAIKLHLRGRPQAGGTGGGSGRGPASLGDVLHVVTPH